MSNLDCFLIFSLILIIMMVIMIIITNQITIKMLKTIIIDDACQIFDCFLIFILISIIMMMIILITKQKLCCMSYFDYFFSIFMLISIIMMIIISITRYISSPNFNGLTAIVFVYMINLSQNEILLSKF